MFAANHITSQPRRISIRLPRPLWVCLAISVLLIAGPMTWAQEGLRPKLLEGAVFWVGNPLSRKVPVPDERITAIAFSPDGKRLIVGRENGLVTTIDVTRHRTIASVKGHASEVNAIVFRPGQASYFTSGEDGRVREWRVAENKYIDFRDERLNSGSPMAISPDGKLLAVGNYGQKGRRDELVSFYHADSGKISHAVRDALGARAVAFSPDSRYLLCVGPWGNKIQLWNVEKAELEWSRTEDRASAGHAIDAPFLSGCAFGPDEQEYTVSIDSGWGDASVCIYDLKTGAVRKELFSKSGHVKFAISPDGKRLATGGYEPIVEIWDTKTGKQMRKFSGQQERIWCLAFSSDSRMVASGGADGTAIVWDVDAAPKR